MDYHALQQQSPRRDNSSYEDHRPQLPSFDHFVRGTGTHDLALRGPPHLEASFADTAFAGTGLGQDGLARHSQRHDLEGYAMLGRRHHAKAEQYSVTFEDYEAPIPEMHRRASDAFPAEIQHPPRPTRAYSSTNVGTAHHDVMRWQHGRVIHEESVPGKGPCYVYDDGTICPKEIDGDSVNPKWGTTKAGKPRKRLGQACNTCREKKIKCDPGMPKCSQCLRFNRECKFDTNSRQSHRSPKFRSSTESPGATTACSPKQHQPSRKPSLAPTEALTPTDANYLTLSRSSNSVEDVLSPTMSPRQPSDAPTPSKRQRLSSSDKSIELAQREVVYRNSSLEEAHQHGFSADADPFMVDSKETLRCVEAFMDNVNVVTTEMFPRQRFIDWVVNNRQKSMHDNAMLYGMMAFGSSQARPPLSADLRSTFKEIIYGVLDELELTYCLQLVQAMSFLCYAEIADKERQKAYTLLVKTVGVIAALQMNIELAPGNETTAYDFPPAVFAECRRRAYWAVFITDTYVALSRGNPRLLHGYSDIYLRVPCSTELFENDQIPKLPLFDPERLLPTLPTIEEHRSMGDMAHLIEISAVVSQVHANAWRCQVAYRIGERPVPNQPLQKRLETRLTQWAEMYNVALRVKEGRTSDSDDPDPKNRHVGGARARKFAGLDLLYHYAHMTLNRRVYHATLSEKEIATYAKNATLHALQALKMARQIRERGGSQTRDWQFISKMPLVAYAIIEAIDILTAAGKTTSILDADSGLMNLMYSGLELLHDRQVSWLIVHVQIQKIEERVQAVYAAAQVAVNERKTYFYCSDRIVSTIDREFDLIYGSDRQAYLRAAYSRDNRIPESEIYELHSRDMANRSQTSASS